MHSIVNHEDAADFHRALAQFNVDRLAIGKPCAEWAGQLQTEYAWRHSEGVYLESLRAAVVPLMPSVMPSGDAFVAWFSALETTGPGQQHRLFDWLAQTATLPQLRWFLTQEAAGEAGFDDLLALTLVKLPVRPKLECARNFWDEMGHGKAAAMHGGMLERMVSGLDLQPSIASTVREALALSNTMIGLASNRRYAYQSIGALGAVELTAPGRVKKVSMAMQRLGLDRKMRTYFDLHAAVDVSHSAAWIREVIRPLIDADPGCARLIAEGALMRLRCGEECFERYSRKLQVSADTCGPAVLTPVCAGFA